MIKALQSIQHIKNNPDSNYLLVGDHDFLYLYIRNLVKNTHFESLESVSFDCSEKSGVEDKILNSLTSIDLFESKKFLTIKNINKVSKKNRDTFINTISKNDGSNIIICTDSSFLGFDYKSNKNFIKNQFVNDLVPFFTVVDVSIPFESEMIRWVKIFSNDFDFKINSKIANDLVEIFGNNFSAIYNEISKLSIIADSIDGINQDWLDSFYDWKKNKQLWELNYAICDKDIDKILSSGLSILNQFGVLYITNSFFTIFEALFLAKLNKGTITDMSRKNLRGKIVNKISSSSEKYTIEEIERGINLLAGLDKKVKTRNIIDESEFTNLITQIYRYE
ncbi:MAG: DNA polymerase III subunit delta [Candidatus Neomarinimicrobiota bacterium]|tara:strand:+ start:128 stop:1132 length:1005 start_codon:yes stop_codon:yes gene_type:complete